MKLYIDSSDYNTVTFAIYNQKLNKKTFKLNSRESFKMLSKLDAFIKKNQITYIYACKGPGSFTGLRVGIAIAQALAMAWDIPLKVVNKTEMDRLIK